MIMCSPVLHNPVLLALSSGTITHSQYGVIDVIFVAVAIKIHTYEMANLGLLKGLINSRPNLSND